MSSAEDCQTSAIWEEGHQVISKTVYSMLCVHQTIVIQSTVLHLVRPCESHNCAVQAGKLKNEWTKIVITQFFLCNNGINISVHIIYFSWFL